MSGQNLAIPNEPCAFCSDPPKRVAKQCRLASEQTYRAVSGVRNQGTLVRFRTRSNYPKKKTGTAQELLDCSRLVVPPPWRWLNPKFALALHSVCSGYFAATCSRLTGDLLLAQVPLPVSFYAPCEIVRDPEGTSRHNCSDRTLCRCVSVEINFCFSGSRCRRASIDLVR